jgi:hypothetical protein
MVFANFCRASSPSFGGRGLEVRVGTQIFALTLALSRRAGEGISFALTLVIEEREG